MSEAVEIGRDKPRSRKGAATRRRLIDAARRVFEETGFVEARVTDIATAAGLAHGSFYSYFDSREAIFRAVAEEVFEEMYSVAPAELEAGDHLGAVAAAHAAYYDFWSRNRKILITIDQVAGFDPSVHDRWGELRRQWVNRYASILESLQRDGAIDPLPDAFHTASALGAMVEQSVRRWVGHGEAHDRALALATLDAIWRRAVGPATQIRTRRKG